MAQAIQLYLIDPDSDSRSTMFRTLRKSGFFVEPFESVDELTSICVEPRLALVHDVRDTVPDFVHRLGQVGQWVPFAVFARLPSTMQIVSAIRQGALDYLDLHEGQSAFAKHVSSLDEQVVASASSGRQIAQARKLIQSLTTRERQVLACVSQGLTNRAIAKTFSISPRTVELHRAKVLSKLGVGNSPEAVKIAMSAGLAN